jgi:hypothetical protein
VTLRSTLVSLGALGCMWCGVGCAFGPRSSGFDQADASVPNLTAESGVTAKCVNLECRRASCPAGRHTTLSGTVYDPAGQSPLYNAIVYVPNGPIKPFVPGVSCDHCGTLTSGDPISVTLTDEHGRFVLDDVPVVDNLPVVIQIGRWRRLITIDQVEECADNPVPVAQTHLPRNQQEGDIPLFAVVTGGFDPLECLLRKIGIDDEEFTGGSGAGRVHLFEGVYGGGLPSSEPSEALYPQIDRYDAVLLACEGDTYPQNKTEDAVYAMLDYLDQGGRVYASHFQYYWFAPFPDGAGADPLPSVAVWDQRAAINDTIDAVVDVGFPKGKAYYDWLSNAGALETSGLLRVQQARHDVNQAVDLLSQSWIHTDPGLGDPQAIQMLTFNTPVTSPPARQCGRVVYSDMHVASQDITGQTFPNGCVTKGLSSQEKALEFMLFDLSSCIQEDAAPPIAPSPPLK